MTTNGLPDNVQELLARIGTQSRDELKLIVELADAIRSADEQLLREVRSVTIHHEIRREEILNELHTLAERLCALPSRPLPPAPAISHHATNGTTIEQNATKAVPPPLDPEATYAGGHWREAAQRIDDEIEDALGMGLQRH